MVRYALLIAASANRVYAGAAPRLTVAELAAFGPVLGVAPRAVEPVRLGEVDYVGFECPVELSERDVAHLSNLSAAYALFERVDDDLLRPVPLRRLDRYDDDLVTIPKYAGKTNEQFTKLLVNVTVLASAAGPHLLDRRLVVLDPLCGRGTTLNQALMYGYDAIGVEVDGAHVDAYSAFLRTWLRHKRIRHRAGTNPVRRNRRLVARRFEAVLTDSEQRVTLFHADTADAREFLRAGCADVLVADAPYGVAHGSRTGPDRSRRPLGLLAGALPVWVELLRPGGALGLAFNARVAARDDLLDLVTGAGLAPVTGPGYADLEHRVDQSISRDVVVARKPG